MRYGGWRRFETANTRLNPEPIALILRHGEAKALLTDREFSRPDEAALEGAILVIDIADLATTGERTEQIKYSFCRKAIQNFLLELPADEGDRRF